MRTLLTCSFLAIAGLSGFASAFAADPRPAAKPASVGMSAERLARIDEVMRADIERGRLPGAVIAVARRGSRTSAT